MQRHKPNFGDGDYVLMGVPEGQHGGKLSLKWRGPYRIVDSKHGYTYLIEDIVQGDRKLVHGDRLRFYDDRMLNITDELKAQFSHDNSSYEVDQLLQLRINESTRDLEILVKWRGFSELENSWEPCMNLWQDVPELVKQFANKHRSHELFRDLDAITQQRTSQLPRGKPRRRKDPAKRG